EPWAAPHRPRRRDVLELLIDSQHGRCGLRAEPGKAREAVGAVADESEGVGDRRGADAALLAHALLVDHEVLAPIELHDPLADDALPEILVRSAEEDLIHSVVVC